MIEPMIVKRWYALFIFSWWLSEKLPFSLLFIAWAFVAALPLLLFLLFYLPLVVALRAADRRLQRWLR